MKKPNKMERTTLDVLFNSDPTVNSNFQPSQKRARRTRAPSFAANRIIAPSCTCSRAPSVPGNRGFPDWPVFQLRGPSACIHKFPINNNTVYLVLKKYRHIGYVTRFPLTSNCARLNVVKQKKITPFIIYCHFCTQNWLRFGTQPNASKPIARTSTHEIE